VNLGVQAASPKSVYIGTSGWHYKHWRGPFYPERFPATEMLRFYSQRFHTVEINATFYRLPPPGIALKWKKETPPGFHFSAKGSRFLTHMKKLRDPETGLDRFFERISGLGRKLGPIAFQLPPQWPLDVGRLEEFLEALPRRRSYAFEFRNLTWHNPAVYRLLAKHKAAFCIFDLAGFQSPLELTADFTYIRLHGPGGKYQGSYDEAALRTWATRLKEWRLRTAYVYFDNDEAAYAPRNAGRMRQIMDEMI
jgi:uncharacterized protein YecE (DUF72 family)